MAPLVKKGEKCSIVYSGFEKENSTFDGKGGGRVLSIVREGREGILSICGTFVIKVTIDYLAK